VGPRPNTVNTSRLGKSKIFVSVAHKSQIVFLPSSRERNLAAERRPGSSSTIHTRIPLLESRNQPPYSSIELIGTKLLVHCDDDHRPLDFPRLSFPLVLDNYLDQRLLQS
jgi:hypothetical protein